MLTENIYRIFMFTKQLEAHLTTITNQSPSEDKPQSFFQRYMNASADFVVKHLLGEDVYQLRKLKSTYILDTLYKRAIEGDNVASIEIVPLWVAKLIEQKFGWSIPHCIYVVTGPENMREISDFGEGPTSSDNREHITNRDNQARAAFDIFNKTLPPGFFLMQQGAQAMHKKGLFKNHLRQSKIVARIARECFTEAFDSWNPNESYQHQMTSIMCDIIGRSLLGIKHLPQEYIPRLRALAKAIIANDQDDKYIETCTKAILEMNNEILKKTKKPNKIVDSILQQLEEDETKDETKNETKRTYIWDDLELYLQDTAAPATKKLMEEKPQFKENYLEQKRNEFKNNPELLRKTLIESRVLSLYIIEGNISMTAMAAIAYLNENLKVKQRLAAEINEFRSKNNLGEDDPIPDTALKNLPYLNCIYLEVLRLTSVAPGATRRTSLHSDIAVSDRNGKKQIHHIAPNSMLFAPTRSSHLDERLWSGRDLHFMSPNPADAKIENNDLYLYRQVDDEEKSETIWYATRTASGVIRAEIKREEYKENFDYLLAALKKPLAENEKINARAKTELIDITFKRKHTRSNPLEFDPSRFEGDSDEVAARRKLLKAFSTGNRQCPAQSEYVPVIIKMILIESLHYAFKLDEKLPTVYPFTTETSWPEEYYATVSKIRATNTVELRR